MIYDDNDLGHLNPELISLSERIHSNHPNPSLRSYKLLGIHLDETLTFDHNTHNTISKLNRSLYCINKTQKFSVQTCTYSKSLFYAQIHSHLNYCPIITSCGSYKNINKISLVQRKVIRTISGNTYHAHTNPIFKNYEILPYTSLIQYAKLQFMHSMVNKYCPASLHKTWKVIEGRDHPHNMRNQDNLPSPTPKLNHLENLLFTPHLMNGTNLTEISTK